MQGATGGGRRGGRRRLVVVVLLAVIVVAAVLASTLRPVSAPTPMGGSLVRASVGASAATTSAAVAPAGVVALVPLPMTGATRLAGGGVPVGYRDDALGAVAAATNYVCALRGNVGMLFPATRSVIVQEIAAPGAVAPLLRAVGPGLDQAAAILGVAGAAVVPGSNIAYRVIPFGWHAVNVSARLATVSVWYESWAGVASDSSSVPVQASYWTDTVSLVWSAGDWKWQGYRSLRGPAPVADAATGSQSSAGDVAAALAAFTPYTYGGA